MRRLKLISDDDCRKDMGGYTLMRWHRFQKRYAADLPPPIVIDRKKFRDAHAWEQFKRLLVARSDPSTLRDAAHRALAAKKAREEASATE
jgi:hypothetical protein